MPATPFSFLTDRVANEVSSVLSPPQDNRSDASAFQDNQVNTYQTATNARTHAIVEANLHLSVHIRETVKGVPVPSCFTSSS